METLTVGAAAARTGWSARMLRYLEEHGLVVPRRTASGYRLYGLVELNRLQSLRDAARPVLGRPRRARLRGAPAARRRAAAGRRRLARQRRRRLVDRLGAAQARAAARRLNDELRPLHWPATEGDQRNGNDKKHDVKDASLAPEGRAADRVGRPADAGAGRDPRAVRARAAAGRLPRRRLSARDDRDGEPDAHAEGRRRRRRALRVEPAVDAGRRRRGARRTSSTSRASRSRARTTTPTTRTSRRRSTTSRS